MGWGSAIRKPVQVAAPAPIFRLAVTPYEVDWARLVTLDFETYYDKDYTLRKLSTSEYVRDKRFEALMVGIKIGKKPTKVVPKHQIAAELKKINWATHGLLCHHTQFDAFILQEHYGIQPAFLFCTLSMARALHSNDIGAGLEEVSQFYGGHGKHQGVLESMEGVDFATLWKNKTRWKKSADYCANDVEECHRVFGEMLPKMPAEEMQIIDITVRMFTDPVLEVDIPRVQAEYERELQEKKDLLLEVVGKKEAVKRTLTISGDARKQQLKRFLGKSPAEIMLEEARKEIASSERFAELLREQGVEPPRKISPAYFKHRDESKKWAYAFSKTDLEFKALLEHPKKRVRDLVECRLSVKSTINETRAERFLKAGADGAKLPVYLKYAAAHTLRWGGGNRMNMQNLRRGSELRKSVKAPKGHVLVVTDSGQIEARTNAWLWDQDDLLDDFRRADAYDAAQQKLPKEKRKPARGDDRDAYCKFADTVYKREITKDDTLERFVGKVSILGLGYQMGAPKLQNTLALGTMGPPVFLDIQTCEQIVRAYRKKNYKIQLGWKKCEQIIADMAAGRTGAYKCLAWEKETLWLPNGMALRYPNLRQKLGGEYPEWVYDRKDEEAKIYGGLLCENIVQALARIIVAMQLLTIAKKYRVVMTTHDEVVACVKAAFGQKAYEFMVKTMQTPLDWCKDIPLNAEGGFDVIYSK